MADYRYCVGSFARALVTGNQVVSGIADTLGSFTPKAVIFWGTAQSAPGTELTARYFFGWSDGPSATDHQHATSTYKGNLDPNTGAPPRFTRAYQTPLYCLALNTDQPTFISDAATMVSFADGAFTLQWGANDGTPWDVHYLVIGGADLTVAVGSFSTPTVTGNQVVPVAALGQISAILFAPVIFLSDVSSGVPTHFSDLMPAFGWATAADQGSLACRSMVISPTRTYFTQRTDQAIQLIDNTNPSAMAAIASRVSLGVGTFTVNWSDVTGAPGVYGNMGTFYLAISGPTVQAGAIVSPGANSTTQIATPFIPGAAIFLGAGQPTTPLVGVPLGYSFGAVDLLDHQRASWIGDANAVTTTLSARVASATRVLSAAAPTGAGVTEQLGAAADIVPTGIDVEWALTDVTPREFLYLAFESALPPPDPPPPPPVPVICEPNWPVGVL